MAFTDNDITALTRDAIRGKLVNQVFVGNPVLNRLMSKNKVIIDSGDQIKQPIEYQELAGGPFTKGQSFDIQEVETMTDYIHDWRAYVKNVMCTINSAICWKPFRAWHTTIFA
ncbi:MAG: hypothetical protein SV062_08075 [Thermodesulfobacteriota bacterium]|nr:hypothetical protein [Thermodesulfobacteriota bacterium]